METKLDYQKGLELYVSRWSVLSLKDYVEVEIYVRPITPYASWVFLTAEQILIDRLKKKNVIAPPRKVPIMCLNTPELYLCQSPLCKHLKRERGNISINGDLGFGKFLIGYMIRNDLKTIKEARLCQKKKIRCFLPKINQEIT